MLVLKLGFFAQFLRDSLVEFVAACLRAGAKGSTGVCPPLHAVSERSALFAVLSVN